MQSSCAVSKSQKETPVTALDDTLAAASSVTNPSTKSSSFMQKMLSTKPPINPLRAPKRAPLVPTIDERFPLEDETKTTKKKKKGLVKRVASSTSGKKKKAAAAAAAAAAGDTAPKEPKKSILKKISKFASSSSSSSETRDKGATSSADIEEKKKAAVETTSSSASVESTEKPSALKSDKKEKSSKKEKLKKTKAGKKSGKLKKTTTISWNNKVEKKRHVRVQDLTPDEVESVWYTESDSKIILAIAKVTVKMMMKGEFCDDIDYCSRGLEGKTPAGAKRRQRNKLRVRSALLEEQEIQRDEGVVDAGYLADICRQQSTDMVREAHEQGLRDEHAIRDYMREAVDDYLPVIPKRQSISSSNPLAPLSPKKVIATIDELPSKPATIPEVSESETTETEGSQVEEGTKS